MVLRSSVPAMGVRLYTGARIRQAVPGRVLHSGKRIYGAVGRAIMDRPAGYSRWRQVGTLPLSPRLRLAGSAELGSMLGRLRVQHVVPLADSGLVVFGYRRITVLGRDGRVLASNRLSGSLPLGVHAAGQLLAYGEYGPNRARSPVPIRLSDDGGRTWSVTAFITGIRHVHGLFADPWHPDRVWMTTGDHDSESALWYGPADCRRFERVIGGSQQTRIVQPVFTEHAIWFGSDAPGETNHIYRLRRTTGEVERVATVGAPVYFGILAGDRILFSTAVEDPATAGRQAEVWCGSESGRWQRIMSVASARLPRPWFPPAQLSFAYQPRWVSTTWINPLATAADGFALELDVSSVAK